MDKEIQKDFQKHFSLSPLPYFLIDRNGKIVSVNQAWRKLTGYAKGDSLGKDFSAFLTSPSAEKFKKLFSSFFKKKYIKNFELEIIKKNGAITPALLNGNIIESQTDGQPYFQCALFDLAKGAEKTSAKIDSIINAREEAIWALDKNHEFIFLNKKFKEVFKISMGVEPVVGLNPFSLRKNDRLIKFWKKKYDSAFKGEIQRFVYSSETGLLPKYSEIILSPIIENNEVVAVSSISIDITEKKILSQQLEEQKIWYESIFENSKDAVFITAEDSRFFLVNKAAQELTGYSKEELLQMSIPDLHEEEDLGAYKKFFDRILSGETIVSEAKILRKDGKKIDAEFSNTSFSIGGKKFMHTIARDISERKYFHEKLEKLMNDYKAVFDNSSDSILIFEPENEIIFDVNKTATQVYGFTYDEFIGMSLKSISKNPERGEKIIAKTLKTGIVPSFTTTQYKKNGEEIIFQINGFVTTYKGKKAIISFNHDITESVKMEKALLESEQLFRDVFNYSSDAIAISEIETGKYIQVNDTFCKLFGYEKEEAIGKTSVELGVWESEKERKNAIKKVQTGTGKLKGHQLNIKTKNGETKTIIATTAKVHIKGKDYYLNSTKDISDIEILKTALSETQALYETLFDELADPVSLHNMKGEIIECNASFLRHIGYSRKEIINKTPRLYVRPDFAKRISGRLKKLKINKEILFESVHVTKDGKEKPVEILAKVIKYKGEDAILAVNRDISERKEAMRKLLESEELFRKIFNNTLDAVTISDIQTGKYISVNKGFQEILGYDEKEAVGKTSMELGVWLSETDRRTFLKKFEEQGSLREYLVKMRAKDGNIKTALISSELIHIGGKDYFLNTGKDITKFIATQNALRETEKQYDMLIEKLADPVILQNLDLTTIECNSAFTKLLGYSKEELLGKTPHFFEAPELAKEIPARLKLFKKKGEILFETAHITKEGRRVPIEINAKKITYKGGEAILSVNRDISERKKAELILRESEERFRTLFENAADSVMICDLKGNIIMCNKKTEKALQYGREELFKMNIGEIDPLFSDKNFRNRFWEELSPEKTITVESLNKRKDGTRFPVESVISEVILDNEKRIIAFVRDISEQRKAQLQQRESEIKFRKAFNENIAPMILTKVGNGLIVDVNESFCKISGYKRNEVVGKTERDIKLWLNKKDIVVFTKILMERGHVKNFAAEFKMKNGRKVITIIAGSLLELKGSLYSLVTAIDITDEIELSRKLELSERTYQTLFEFSPLGIILKTPDGIILDVNKTFCNMFQYSRNELVGKNVSDLNILYDPDTNIQRIISGKQRIIETVNYRKDKTEIHLALREIGIDLPNGKKGILTIAIDVTERKKYEAEIHKSRKELKRLTKYLQNVREKERGEISRRIHDALGQSLTTVQFETAWLEKHIPNQKEIAERLERLKATVDEMTKEVQNISRDLRPGMLDELGLAFAIEWYCDEFERKSGIKTHKKIEPEELIVDPETSIHIFRMAQECLTNVWRHSKATRVNVELIQKPHGLYLSIRDNGVGLDKEKLHDLKSLGLLGLRERVYSLRGQIEFISAPSKGTKIKIVIPITKDNGNPK